MKDLLKQTIEDNQKKGEIREANQLLKQQREERREFEARERMERRDREAREREEARRRENNEDRLTYLTVLERALAQRPPSTLPTTTSSAAPRSSPTPSGSSQLNQEVKFQSLQNPDTQSQDFPIRLTLTSLDDLFEVDLYI